MESETFRREATKHLDRIRAAERIRLRRWLRDYYLKSDDEIPSNYFLSFDVKELSDSIRNLGGDPSVIRAQARSAVIDQITGTEVRDGN